MRQLLLLCLLPAGAVFAADPAVETMSIFAKRCLACHGSAAMAGLRLDQPGAQAAGVIVPKEPEQSRLWLMLNGKGRALMPPTGKLPEAELSTIREWIVSGASWPNREGAKAAAPAASWWSFQSPRKPAVPSSGEAWARNEIDRFVAAKLEQKQWKPAPEADRRTLIRRVTFDLTGLPPTASEIEAFLADSSPTAYEKLVDRLLASPRYGERWAKRWLDLVRYGDTGGFEQDPYMLYAWRYRDYVIQSFNSDKPYNTFIEEQIAGDELFEDPQQQQGTGYYTVGANRDMLYKVEDINRVETLTDFVDTTASVFLGLTAGCARCHDHKYDPIPQKDYFRLQAIFAPFQKTRVFLHYNDARGYDISEVNRIFKLWDIGAEVAAIKKPYYDKVRAERLAKLSPEIQSAFATPEDQRTPQQKAFFEEYVKKVQPSDDVLWPLLNDADRNRLEAIKKRLLSTFGNVQPGPFAPGLTDVGRESPKTFLPVKGNPLGEEVQPGFLTALGGGEIPEPPLDSPTTRRRAALAKWLASEKNPLTARVMVNRVWQHHFGRGLLPTTSDFGARGGEPTHPELLDWLAVRFVEEGWSIKKLHRAMLLSATYRQSAAASKQAREQDTDNALLSHFPRRRLEAEEIRDAVLQATGQLNLKMFGRPVVPALAAEELYGMSQSANTFWPVTTDVSEHRRRSLYMLVRRTYRMPMLEVFDQPEGVLPCPRRESSTTATQSLSLLNSRFTVEQAEALAKRTQDPVAIYRAVLLRDPREEELQLSREFLAKQEKLAGGPIPAARELVRALLNTNEFLYVE